MLAFYLKIVFFLFIFCLILQFVILEICWYYFSPHILKFYENLVIENRTLLRNYPGKSTSAFRFKPPEMDIQSLSETFILVRFKAAFLENTHSISIFQFLGNYIWKT